MKKVLLFAVIILSCISGAYAQEPSYPAKPQGYVSDYVGVLSSTAKAQISGLAQELEQKTTAQVAVVILGSVKPETIEGYAVHLFQQWGIGQKGKDNGVLLLIAYTDRKLRIESGYGLEGVLPDARCKQIIDSVIVPHFKQGDFSTGIYNGAVSILSLVAQEYNVTLEGMPANVSRVEEATTSQKVVGFIISLLFFLFIISSRMGLLGWFILGAGHRRRGGYWYGSGASGSSGGFSGGFGGFGGGFSGGGGASGGW